MRSLAACTIVLCSLATAARATSCSRPAPCARLSAGTILFSGTVTSVQPADDGRRSTAILKVEESFLGLPEDAREITLQYEGDWIQRGHTYVIDAGRAGDGTLWPRICGATDEVGSAASQELLAFLRRLKTERLDTTLTVSVSAYPRVVAGATVTVQGPDRILTGVSGSAGQVRFAGLLPGSYKFLSAAKEHFVADPKRTAPAPQDLVQGSCGGMRVDLVPAGVISGTLLDPLGHPLAGMPLEVQDAQDRHSFRGAKTAEDGTFRFEGLGAGSYYLGTNLASLEAPVPRTFYPGVRSRDGAFLVTVDLERPTAGLLYTLPDFGPDRTITLYVLDASGNPVPGARLASDSLHQTPDRAALPAAQTDAQGKAVIVVKQQASYRVLAAIGDDLDSYRLSNSMEVPAGQGPVTGVLTLGPTFEELRRGTAKKEKSR